MVHQLQLFLLLFGALQGLLLSLWFFRNQHREWANLYMGLFLFVIGLQLTMKVITKVWMMNQVLFLYILSFYLPFLIGPLLFLYLKSKKCNPFHPLDLCHFLPFLLTVGIGWLQEILPYSPYYLPVYATTLLQILSLGFYCYQSLKLSTATQKLFILLTVATEGIIILTLAIMYYKQVPDIRWLFIVLSFLIYYISYKLISRSAPFSELGFSVVEPSIQPATKYAHSGLKTDEADRIENLLKQVMEKEKLFLNPSLSIDSLSVKLSISRHHLSQVLNNRLEKSFTEYINELRVQEACRRLSDPANFKYTIASVAFDCCFNSIATFNEVFKKHYQTTPSKFRQLLLK